MKLSLRTLIKNYRAVLEAQAQLGFELHRGEIWQCAILWAVTETIQGKAN